MLNERAFCIVSDDDLHTISGSHELSAESLMSPASSTDLDWHLYLLLGESRTEVARRAGLLPPCPFTWLIIIAVNACLSGLCF
jgi:hypothetical protein